MMLLPRTNRAPAPDRPRPSVLCVDDEPAILAALRRSLRGQGYDLLTAGSAAEALEILGESPVRLVISDQLMPGMSGVELLREVRRRVPTAVVVLLTGYPEGMPGEAGVAAGIRWVLTKPWSDEELRRLVDRLLSEAEEGLDDPQAPGTDVDLGGGD